MIGAVFGYEWDLSTSDPLILFVYKAEDAKIILLLGAKRT